MASKIIISGITGSVGSLVAKNLVESDYEVAGIGRDEEAIAAAREALPGVSIECVDATEPKAFVEALDKLRSGLGGCDGYVHAVGSIFLKPAHLTRWEDFEKTLMLNLGTAFSAVQWMGKNLSPEGMKAVFFSSSAARIGIANHEAIAAAKAGVEGLVRSAAASYASRGLRINAIAPGLVDSKMAKPMTGSPQALKVSQGMHPLGRIGKPGEIASMVGYLLGEGGDWVTGQTLTLDGGMSAVLPKPRV